MSTHENTTNKTKTVTLPSSIERVQWADLQAAPGGTVGLEIATRNVGNGSTLQTKLTDHRGRSHGTFEDPIHNNYLSTEIRVPPAARDALYAEVILSAHGLQQWSPALLLTDPVEIKNAEWSQDQARRGDVLTLSADVRGVPDGTKATIQIFEHDEESAHEPITGELPARVEKEQVEVEWKYKYPDGSDHIPIDRESNIDTNIPKLFFLVSVAGKSVKSKFLNISYSVLKKCTTKEKTNCDKKEWNEKLAIYNKFYRPSLKINHNFIYNRINDFGQEAKLMEQVLKIYENIRLIQGNINMESKAEVVAGALDTAGEVLPFAVLQDQDVVSIVVDQILEAASVAVNQAQFAEYVVTSTLEIAAGLWGKVGISTLIDEYRLVSSAETVLFWYYDYCGDRRAIEQKLGLPKKYNRNKGRLDFISWAVMESRPKGKLTMAQEQNILDRTPKTANTTPSIVDERYTKGEQAELHGRLKPILEGVDNFYKREILKNSRIMIK